MMKNLKLSLRLRLTIIASIVLTIACIFLTFVINLSANKMVDIIKPVPILPSISATESNETSLIELTPAQQAHHNFRTESLFAMFGIVLVGSIITYLISDKALKPIAKLNQKVNEIQINNLSDKIEIPRTGDEVEQLAISFNEMTSNLESAFSVQKQFSADAAHELRTPLTVLQTKIEVFQKSKDHTTLEYENLIQSIQNQTTRLSKIVKDLLILAREDPVLLSQYIDITALLNEIIEELSSVAQQKNISLSIHSSNVFIKGNDALLQQVFYNLIENAIKYNSINGYVDITVAEFKNNITISIADSGNGIANNVKGKIFEPFYRIDKSRNRKIGGSGLGLAIVKRIIQRHQGTIEVIDNIPNGSIFVVTLNK